jgi:haloacetate dehalogenase
VTEPEFFPGFEVFDEEIAGVAIHGRIGGAGPPVLLLHGYPQTHVMWHLVAPALAGDRSVVVADLRGYGDSAKPAAGPDNLEYSKRVMAADQVALMARLGFGRFAAAGHDRGARVVHRMCLDHPGAVERAAVLDIVPTSYAYDHVDRALAEKYFHWFFLSQPPDLPERLIGSDPEYYLRRQLSAWAGPGSPFDEAAVAQYVRCFADPAAIAATCADYRAAAGIDLQHAAQDAGRLVSCPLLVLWGRRGFVGARYDVLAVWREFAADAGGGELDCGHFLPEEQPAATTAALAAFLRQP